MSIQEAISRLAETLRSLVLAVSKDIVDGPSEKDVGEVKRWIDKASKAELVSEANLKSLDSHLDSRTFLVSNQLTAADVAVYGALHPVISSERPAQYYSHPSVTRYFDHIQTRPQVRSTTDSLLPPLPLVTFDLENAPKPTRTAEPPKKEKAPKPASEAALSGKKAADVKPAEDAGKEGKKEKKEFKVKKKEAVGADTVGKKASGKGGGASAANEALVPVPSMIDLRVGHIIDVKKHPDADGLYVEQIDIGEETGPRTVVSGLVNFVPIERMRDKWLVAVCNLKPATMRGVKSFAMVLCATSKDGREGGVEVIDPPKGSKPGDRVYFEGYEDDTPLEQLNPKRKIFETVQPGFITLDSREAAWVDPVKKSVHRIRTKEGPCTAPTFVGASLS